jgi:hypothetical protein
MSEHSWRGDSIRETFKGLGRSVRALFERPGLNQWLSELTIEIGAQPLATSQKELAAIKHGLAEHTRDARTLR